MRSWAVKTTTPSIGTFATRSARSRLAGITQFLDLGAGLPTPPPGLNTHQVVNPRYIAPNTRRGRTVVYVDNDPVCLAHGRAYLEHDDYHSIYLPGSICHPDTLLGHPRVRTRSDPTQPWGVLAGNLLHYIDDQQNPAQAMRCLIEALPGGSYVVLAHYGNPYQGGLAERLAAEMQHRYLDGLSSGWFRSHATIAAYLDGLQILAPGFITPDQWWPSGPKRRPVSVEQRLILAAVARKPVAVATHSLISRT